MKRPPTTGRPNLGELEEQVLLALLQLGGESYAGQVAEELAARTRREVSPATAFMVLRRLEQRRLVTSRVDRAEASWGGRPRRIYVVQKTAVLPLLRSSRRARLALWDGLEGLLR